jgi:hypothetical protein
MDDEFNEGMDAFNDGKDITDNPYEDGTEAYFEWDRGWYKAHMDDGDGLEEEGTKV